jgi:hypothetical protein
METIFERRRVMDEKNYIQLSEKGYEACCIANASFGYQRGVKDALRGMGLGIAVVVVGALGALIIDSIVENHKHRKQTEEAKNDVSK